MLQAFYSGNVTPATQFQGWNNFSWSLCKPRHMNQEIIFKVKNVSMQYIIVSRDIIMWWGEVF